jgi:hypothetical protein
MVVVEADVGAEMEDPGEGVGALPGGGEPGLEVEVVVFADEGVVDELAYTLGLGVGALAEVEVVGGGFYEEGQGIGGGCWGATSGEGDAKESGAKLKDAAGHNQLAFWGRSRT